MLSKQNRHHFFNNFQQLFDTFFSQSAIYRRQPIISYRRNLLIYKPTNSLASYRAFDAKLKEAMKKAAEDSERQRKRTESLKPKEVKQEAKEG